MAQSTTPRQRVLFVTFLLALFPVWQSLQPKLDEDTWWHLAVGRYVVEHRAVPQHDPFSRIGQEQQIPWVAYSWLHEVALYGSYQLVGLGGVIAVRQLLDAFSFVAIAWFILRRGGKPVVSLIVLALLTATIMPMMLERPWHYTIAFTTLCLHAALEMREGAPARRFWWLVPFFALWANLHIQFVLGFGVLGLGLLCVWAEQRRVGRKDWAALILACVLATLVNPYHVRIYHVVWEYATQTGALKVVEELNPPDMSRWWNWAMIALLLGAAVDCSRRRLPLFDTAFLIVGAVFSLRMQRDNWFGAVIAAGILSRGPSRWPAVQVRLIHLAALFLAAILVERIAWKMTGQRTIAHANQANYPVEAVDRIRETKPPGPIFNHFNWGGYLIWALPEYPVGMDGRTNLYGEERLLRAFRTWKGEDGWDADPDLLAAGVIVAPKKFDAKLGELLRVASDRWRVVHEDEVAVVFLPVAR
jgi:hypothetical protein